MKLSITLFIFTLLTSCAHVGAGVDIEGGSSGKVNVGAGVHVHLLSDNLLP